MDRVVEFLGWFFFLKIWVLTIVCYRNFPEIIPIHYSVTGQPDGFGTKETIWILPIIVTVLFVGLTILNKFPHVFNYPNNITEGNAQRQYTNATRLIRYLKLSIVIIFGLIVIQTFRNVTGSTSGVGGWFLPLSIGLLFMPLVYFVAKSLKTPKQ